MGIRKSLLFIFHEAERTGASIVLFRYIKWLSENTDFRLSFLLKVGGPLEEELREMGEIFYYQPYKEIDRQNIVCTMFTKIRRVKPQVQQFFKLGVVKCDIIIANTLVCAPIIMALKRLTQVPVGWYIHELALAEKILSPDYDKVIPLVDLWIANSGSTLKFIKEHFGINDVKCVINYPAVVVPERIENYPLIEKWKGKFIIGTSGTAIPRKGCDLFILLAIALKKKYPDNNLHFVWVGYTGYCINEISYDIVKAGLEDTIEFTGEVADPFLYYKNFDVFVSTSKEESFGLACAEAAAIGTPVVGFEGSGELERIIKGCKGKIVPYLDIELMIDALIDIYESPVVRAKMSRSSKEFATQFSGLQLYENWLKTLNILLNNIQG